MARKQQTRVLRGYVKKRPNGRFVAVCLKPNLVVEGATQREALEKILDLIPAYIADAAKDGRLEHFMAQRAPLRFYVEYVVGQMERLVRALDSFKPIAVPYNIPQHG